MPMYEYCCNRCQRKFSLRRPMSECHQSTNCPDCAAVACHEHGTGLSGFLPGSWDHLGCQSWDHPARLAGGPWDRSLTAHVMTVDVEVVERGIQGGQRG